MKIRIIIVGKTTNAHYQALCDDYISRIGHYQPAELCSIKPERILQQRPEEICRREGARMLASVSPSDYCVALDSRGEGMNSAAFAQFLQRQMAAGSRTLVFCIGGPHGLGAQVIERANQRLSLSAMTFAHELALTVFLEQLYRGFSILRNEKYHK